MALAMFLGSIAFFIVSFILFAMVVILEDRDHDTLATVIKLPAILTGKASEILFILSIVYGICNIFGV